MKRYIVLPLLLLLSMQLVYSQRRPKIKGNRSVTEVREELPPFTAVELKDNLEIRLKKSFGEGYEIIADDNLVDVLKFEVVDSTLVISSFYTIVSKKKLEITVNFKELTAITAKDGVIYSTEVIESDGLYINAFGNSQMDLDTSGFMATINAEDNSKIELNLDIDSLQVDLKQRADASIYAVSGVNTVTLNDNASLTFEGTAENLKVDMAENTKLKGDKMEAAEVELVAQGAAFARIYAYRNLLLNASGTSRTHLYGNPKITVAGFADTAQLLKKTE